MYQYNLQFDRVPPDNYTGFYNQTPFYIGLTTTDPNYDQLRINFFSQDSNSSPYQIPQSKWSHLVPQWKFVNSEGDFIEFEKPYDLDAVVGALSNAPGIMVKDDPLNNIYPMPLDAHNKDEVFVGRIRRDYSIDNGLNIWIVSDNLRKGAATNAVQIAEYLIDNVI